MTTDGAPDPIVTSPQLPIGQTLYTTYLDQYHRRLRKGVPTPKPEEGAGLLSGHRFHGRATPAKGKGTPPADAKEQKHARAKQMVPGKSFAASYNLIAHPESAEAAAGAPSVRSSVRITGHSYVCQLAGGAATVTSEAVPNRPKKRPSTATVKTARVLCLDEAFDGPLQVDAAYAYYSSVRAGAFACRPSTAPPCVLRNGQTLARKHYEQCAAGHADVFRYRHSGGICPDEYKFSTDRQAAPQLVTHTGPVAREAFLDSRRSYDLNKVRAHASVSFA